MHLLRLPLRYPATTVLALAMLGLFARDWCRSHVRVLRLAGRDRLAVVVMPGGRTAIATAVLVRGGALDLRGVRRRGEVWRLLAATLLHVNLGHLLANLLVGTWASGWIERRLGSVSLLVLFFACGAGANAVSLAAHWRLGSFVGAGSSGPVYGLLAILATTGRGRDGRRRILWWALAGLAAAIVAGEWLPGIWGGDVAAHAGGAATGLLLGGFDLMWRRLR